MSPVSPSSSAQAARQAIADRLREIRLDAGLTKRELARAVGWHESKCSRIEHAKTAPADADIRLLSAQVAVTAPSEIAEYAKAFQQLSEHAVYGADARKLINAAIGALDGDVSR